jgi:SAM-dependent methyltransferase
MRLLSDEELERSWTVANSAMNRDRGLIGPNSYAKELGFNPLDFLREHLMVNGDAAWLDLCCGNGRALREAANELTRHGAERLPQLVGIDLVATWPGLPPELPFVSLRAASLHAWRPARSFNLITCVHGLHYLGDKLSLIERAARWLSPGGRFVAHLDLGNLRLRNGKSMSRPVLARFRQNGLKYNRRRLLLVADGPRAVHFGYSYLGADADAGPNATGQCAVNSYYAAQ